MEDKIKESMERKGVQVDDPLHVGLHQIMSDHTREIQKKYDEGSFHHLFWDQQTKKFVQISYTASLASNAHSLVFAFENDVQFSI